MESEKQMEFQAAPPQYTAAGEVSAPLLPQGNYTAEAQAGYGYPPSYQPSYPPSYPPSYQPSASDQSGQAVPAYQYPAGGAYQPTVSSSGQAYAPPGAVAYAPYGPGMPGQQPTVVLGQPGQLVPPGATVMVVSGPTDPRVHKIKDLLPLSIINLICCCLVFGIVATVYSVRIREAKRHNDYAGAKKMYKVMLGWNISGMVIGTVLTIIYIMLEVTGSSE